KPVPLPVPTGVACPKCKEGELMERRGKFGRPFYGCNRYPKCDYITNDLAQVSAYVPGDDTAPPNGTATRSTGRAGKPATSRATTAATTPNGRAGKTTARATGGTKTGNGRASMKAAADGKAGKA